MLQSKLFTKTRKEAPKDEVAKNAQLLIRGGFIHKEMAGVYDFLPLGLRVLNKIVGVIREEMNAIGAVEVELSSLQDRELWQKTDRWSDEVVDTWFKTKFKNENEVGLAFTHEEPLTRILTEHVSSYRDLPLYVYQFQTKFRNETRAKSGLIRAREFLMKDLYSFSPDEKSHTDFYERAKDAYRKIFNRLGLGEKTFVTYASGGAFSEFSEEFQTVCEAGEDTIYVSEEKGLAVNQEIANGNIEKLGLTKDELLTKTSVEVGNIFNLGTRFSKALGLSFVDEKGKKQPVVMGSYGIGPGRVMGTIVELFHDKDGIIWPESVAPFKIHLIEIAGKEGGGVRTTAEKLYAHLTKEGKEVLFDDREGVSAGEKFADADLIGIPYRVVVSEKTVAEGKYELKNRATGEVKKVTDKEIFSL